MHTHGGLTLFRFVILGEPAARVLWHRTNLDGLWAAIGRREILSARQNSEREDENGDTVHKPGPGTILLNSRYVVAVQEA